MTIVGTGSLGDSLTIRNLRLTKLNLNLLVVLQTPLESAEMELAHTTDDGLTKLFAHFDTPCRILFALTGNDLHHLLVLTLVDSLDAAAIARTRIFDLSEGKVSTLGIQRIAGAGIFQFHGSTDIACVQFIHLGTNGSVHCENLGDTLLGVAVHVLQIVTRTEHALSHLEVVNLTDMRLYRGLEHVNRSRSVVVAFDLLAFGGNHRVGLIYRGSNVAQEFHQTTHAHVLACAHAEYREHVA